MPLHFYFLKEGAKKHPIMLGRGGVLRQKQLMGMCASGKNLKWKVTAQSFYQITKAEEPLKLLGIHSLFPARRRWLFLLHLVYYPLSQHIKFISRSL